MSPLEPAASHPAASREAPEGWQPAAGATQPGEPRVTLRAEGLAVVLHSARGSTPLLQGMAFALRRQTVLGVLGESGSGKSVLARALCNALEPPLSLQGQLVFDGRNLAGQPRAAMAGLWGRRIAYIGADPTRHFDPTMAVGAQIVEKLRAVEPGVTRARATERVIALLDEVRIPQARQRFGDLPQHYSGGMIQRAAIADALITDPELLIADSITQPLDTTVAAQILRLLQALRQRFHTAIVFMSSSPAVIAELADEVLVLAGGRVAEQGPAAQVLGAPGHPATQQMLKDVPRVWRGMEAAELPGGERRAAPGPDAVGDGEAGLAQRGPAAAATPLLHVQALHKRYAPSGWGRLAAGSGAGQGAVHAVRGVSFELRRGEHLGIVGESGCGKSTLSRLLSGLEAPDAGRIVFDGADLAGLRPAELKALRRRFQLVLPDPYQSLPAHWPIGRIVAEPLRIHGRRDARSERETVLAVLQEVGLPAEWLERLPGGLSAGQRQRVNLARALVLAPELLILDETLSALDAAEQRQLIELLSGLQQRRGLTTIFISHDLAMLRGICDRIAVMYLGRIVELGANWPTFSAPLHPYTRALLAALPVLEPNPFAREQCLLDGETPSAIDLPVGCSFASRCPQVVATCRIVDPAFVQVGARGGACHLLARSDGSA